MTKQPAVFYEIFVRSFADSNGDGIGDLNGIRSKLDYLVDLGIEGIWLSPIFKSPSYHKYDISDYFSVDPEYGTKEDLIQLINEAKEKGIVLILDLVINHTSSVHKWFRVAQNPNSQYRDYYHWLTKEEIGKRGIEKRKPTDDSGLEYPWHWPKCRAKEKYFGMFWSEMPDLNLANEQLKDEIISIAKYWLSLGIAGFRLDAAKHIFPSWEPAEKNHHFWKEFRSRLEEEYPEVYLVGEVWDTPQTVAPYFESLQANFNIDLSYDLKDLLKNGLDEKRLIDKLLHSYKIFGETNSSFIDATLLSNHDQTRIGTLLKGDLSKLKQAANILMTLPGQPFLYYGEEIGLLGDKPDEYIREPYPWESASETYWIARRNKVPDQDYQLNLFNHYKSLIALRKNTEPLGTVFNNLQKSPLEQTGIFSFIRYSENESFLIIHNLNNERSKLILTESISSYIHLVYSIGTEINIDDSFYIPAFGMLILAKTS